jgi:hypothetical protein
MMADFSLRRRGGAERKPFNREGRKGTRSKPFKAFPLRTFASFAVIAFTFLRVSARLHLFPK